MSSYCKTYAQSCTYSCCNSTGQCPSYSSNCYYYYSGSSNTNADLSSLYIGPIVGGCVGFVGFVVTIVLIVYFVRRHQAAQAAAVAAAAAASNMNSTIIVPNPVGNSHPAPVYAYPNGTYSHIQPYGAYPNQQTGNPQVVYASPVPATSGDRL